MQMDSVSERKKIKYSPISFLGHWPSKSKLLWQQLGKHLHLQKFFDINLQICKTQLVEIIRKKNQQRYMMESLALFQICRLIITLNKNTYKLTTDHKNQFKMKDTEQIKTERNSCYVDLDPNRKRKGRGGARGNQWDGWNRKEFLSQNLQKLFFPNHPSKQLHLDLSPFPSYSSLQNVCFGGVGLQRQDRMGKGVTS